MLATHCLEAAGIDVDDGMAYCADDEEFFEEMLAVFCDEANRRSDDLANHFAQKDWEGYRICAHALKTMAKTIGANEFSEASRVMEFFARDADTEALILRHESYLASYKTLVASIDEALSGSDARC